MRRRSTEIAGRLALLVGSVFFTLAGLEIGCRLWRGPQWLFQWPNLVRMERQRVPMEWPVCSYVYDRTAGWAPNPNFTSKHYNVDPDGFRRMPPLPAGAIAAPVVLATGDSFTEGDEVDDNESWPAYLQGMIGRRTINGGVGGFGLDQTVLRTEQLAAATDVAVAVVGFIPDDLRRTEMSRTWNVYKPYFEFHNGGLEVHNFPAPPPRAACDSLPFWQRLFGWSVMIDGLARRQGLMVDWIFDDVVALPSGTGRELACPLIRRLVKLNIPTLVIAQYDRTVWQNGPTYRDEQHRDALRVLDCAAEAGLATFDFFDTVERAIATQGINAIYLYGHHSAAANRMVAGVIAEELVHRRLLPGPR